MTYVIRELTEGETYYYYMSTSLYEEGKKFLLNKGYITDPVNYDGCYLHEVNGKTELICRIGGIRKDEKNDGRNSKVVQ